MKSGLGTIDCEIPRFFSFLLGMKRSIVGGEEAFFGIVFVLLREGIACPKFSNALRQLHGFDAVRVGGQIAVNRKRIEFLLTKTVFDPEIERHSSALDIVAGRMVTDLSPSRR